MMDRITAWFPIMTLVLLAAVTVWLDRQVQPPEGPRDGTARHDPDYMIENIAATRIGADGNPRYTLSARRVTHYPDDDSTHLDAPRLVRFAPDQGPVTMSSRTALVSSNGADVYLMDDVKVVRAPYAKHSELVLETPYLHIVPDDDVAQTDKPVKIHDANTLISAVGLEFNNATRILKLLSHVRGTYDKRKLPR